MPQRDGGTLTLDDDRVSNLIEVDKLGRCPQHDLIPSLLDFSRRKIQVGIANGFDHPVQRQTDGPDPVRVEFNPDLPVEASPHVNLRYPRNAGKAVADLIFNQFRELHRIEVA